jgi:hypothetical protein
MATPNRKVAVPKKISARQGKNAGSRDQRRGEFDVRHGASAALAASAWLISESKKKPLRQCRNCGAVFADGHWHKLRADKFLKKLWQQAAFTIAECEACRLEREAHGPVGAAGELRVAELPWKIKTDVLRTIRNAGKTAVSRDPEERIIEIAERGRGLLVTVTQNQLAVRIGKKLDSAFKGGRLRISYSEIDLPARVYWTPPIARTRK